MNERQILWMKVKTPLQKSIFSKAFKRKILFPGCAALLSLCSCQASGGDNPDHNSIQYEKRKVASGRSIPPLNTMVDSIVVLKSKREMIVFGRKKQLKTYIISLGAHPVGKKRSQGDYKTPEGHYTINDKNPNSIYHKNLGISYPNPGDLAYASSHKLAAGGDVKIHGLPNRQQYKTEAYLNNDWTWGCIAVSNEEINELYRFVQVGTVIELLP